jgi:hypothetical protein
MVAWSQDTKTIERILCTGDVWCHPSSGLSSLLEAHLRRGNPSAHWRFWHLGDAACSARTFLDEAAWKLLGRDAQRILVSIGHAPQDRDASESTLAAIGQLLELLATKRLDQVWILLPTASLWPESERDACLRLRQKLSEGFPELHRIDLETEVKAFLEAQDAQHGIGLCQPGMQPTSMGAFLLSGLVAQSWA